MMDSQVTIITDERMINIYSNGVTSDDKELAIIYKHQYERLRVKRLNLLVSLRDAINNEIGEET